MKDDEGRIDEDRSEIGPKQLPGRIAGVPNCKSGSDFRHDSEERRMDATPRRGATPNSRITTVPITPPYSAGVERQGGRSTSVSRPIGSNPSDRSIREPGWRSGSGSGDLPWQMSGCGRGLGVTTIGGKDVREQDGPEQVGTRSGGTGRSFRASALAHSRATSGRTSCDPQAALAEAQGHARTATATRRAGATRFARQLPGVRVFIPP